LTRKMFRNKGITVNYRDLVNLIRRVEREGGVLCTV